MFSQGVPASTGVAERSNGAHADPMLNIIALAIAATNAPCPGSSTIDVNACLDARVNESDRVLNRYFQTALKRARKENGREAAQRFIQAERLWIAFRDAECASVFDRWRGGTIKVSMELQCRIRLTRVRTYTIWRDWLTFPDSTPPLLPRPNIESVASER